MELFSIYTYMNEIYIYIYILIPSFTSEILEKKKGIMGQAIEGKGGLCMGVKSQSKLYSCMSVPR